MNRDICQTRAPDSRHALTKSANVSVFRRRYSVRQNKAAAKARHRRCANEQTRDEKKERGGVFRIIALRVRDYIAGFLIYPSGERLGRNRCIPSTTAEDWSDKVGMKRTL